MAGGLEQGVNQMLLGALGGEKDKAPILPTVQGAASLQTACKNRESVGHLSAAWYFAKC